MSTETGILDQRQAGLWRDSIATTDAASQRFMIVDQSSPWTEVIKEHAEMSLDTFGIMYHGDEVSLILRRVPMVRTAATPTLERLRQWEHLSVHSAPARALEGLENKPQRWLSSHASLLWSHAYKKLLEGHQESAENITRMEVRAQGTDEKVEALFEVAMDEIFEDGVESQFSRQLVSYIRSYGDAAMEAIADLIVYERANQEVISEALRWVGVMDHPPTHNYRLWLLERSLQSSSARVRDGALLGLVYLEDPHAMTYLKRAIEKEQCGELRRDMETSLAQLESKTACPSS